MATIEERVSRLEGAYEHLATQADVQGVRVEIQEVKTEIQKLKSDLTIRLGALIIASSGVTIAILRYFS